jgi:hypothetical protein
MPIVLFGTWNTVPSSFGAGTPGATGYAQPGIPGAFVTGAGCCWARSALAAKRAAETVSAVTIFIRTPSVG